MYTKFIRSVSNLLERKDDDNQFHSLHETTVLNNLMNGSRVFVWYNSHHWTAYDNFDIMEFKKISSLSVCVSYFILVVDLVVILIASLILLFVDVMMKLFIPFMRPCSRNKKLQEEWIVPLKFVKDMWGACSYSLYGILCTFQKSFWELILEAHRMVYV